MKRKSPIESAKERKAASEGETVAQDRGDTKKQDFLERMRTKRKGKKA